MADFGAIVTKWAGRTEQKQKAVFHRVLHLVVEETSEWVPVETGNLRNSIAVSISPVVYDWKTKKFREPEVAVNAAISGIEPGTTAYIGYRAPYAHKIEKKHAFMRLVLQRWPHLLKQAVKGF